MGRKKEPRPLDTRHQVRLPEDVAKEYLYYQAKELRLKGEKKGASKLTRELIVKWLEGRRELYDDEFRKCHPKGVEVQAS